MAEEKAVASVTDTESGNNTPRAGFPSIVGRPKHPGAMVWNIINIYNYKHIHFKIINIQINE